MSGPIQFWVYRKTNGCVTTSTIAHPDEDGYYEDGPFDGPDGAWELLDSGAWDLTAKPCLRGRCVHTPTPAPKTQSVNERRMSTVLPSATPDKDTSPMPEAEWRKAMETMATAFTAIQAHVAMVWEPLKSVFASAVDLMHTVRIEAPHTQVCASETGGNRCFCACAACFEDADEDHPPLCVCDFCDCKVDA